MEEKRNKNERLEDILTWQRNHDIADAKQFAEIHKTLKNIPCKEDVKDIVDKSIQDNITKKGTTAKNFIISAAIIVTSITAIALGAKMMLAWIGIKIIR